MIHGLLVVNLDPPYAGFRTGQDSEYWKDFTVEELREFLIEIEALSPDQTWPPREYVLRMHGQFKVATLAKLGLRVERPLELNSRR